MRSDPPGFVGQMWSSMAAKALPGRCIVAFCAVLLAGLGAGSTAGSAAETGTAQTKPAKPIACKDLRTLRELGPKLTKVTNSRTGDTADYIVLGDGAKSDELLVMFPGTGQVLPDWPTQMITNRHYSPAIATTASYNSDQDGPISLCHDYRLLMFDYPGVGDTALPEAETLDSVASDVDAILEDAGKRYHIPTNSVSLVGWSLGTVFALKYALLSPAARPSRHINDLVLIASRAGGRLDGLTDNNQASCVSSLFDELTNESVWNGNTKLRNKIDTILSELTFPYLFQKPNNGISSGCTASVNTSTSTVTLNVTLNCPDGSACKQSLADAVANRLTKPWSITGGIDYDLFVQQRELAYDWSYGYCPVAGDRFNSRECVFAPSQKPEMSAANGGVCVTESREVNRPISRRCAELRIDGKLTVINGPEDLFIQWTYGRAMVRGFRDAGLPAALVTYHDEDGAGHGVLIQHPLFAQEYIFWGLGNRGGWRDFPELQR